MKQTTLEKIKNAVKALEEKGAPFTQGDLAKEAECSSLTVCYAIKEGHLHFVPVGEQRDNYLLKELRKGKFKGFSLGTRTDLLAIVSMEGKLFTY